MLFVLCFESAEETDVSRISIRQRLGYVVERCIMHKASTD